MKGRHIRLRFFNMYEPVTSFYRDLLPYLANHNISSEVVVSAAQYRPGGRTRLSEALSHPSIRVRNMPVFGLQPNGRVSKAILMTLYVITSGLVSLFGRRVDINFFLTQPPLFFAWGWILKKIRRQPYVCLVMDIYPAVAIQSGLLQPLGLASRFLRRMNKQVWRDADALIVIGRCMAEKVTSSGVPSERIHLIPNWSDPERIFPVPAAQVSLRRYLGLVDKFVVLYSGNMGIAHDFGDLLEVIRRLRSDPGVHFVFIGKGSRRRNIEHFIATHQLRNAVMLPFQGADMLAESLSLGDVHFVSLRSGFEGLLVPSKAYGALAAGRPIIYQGHPSAEIALMIDENDIGVVVPPESPDDLLQAINDYRNNPELALRQGRAARVLGTCEYSPKYQLDRYLHVVASVANE